RKAALLQPRPPDSDGSRSALTARIVDSDYVVGAGVLGVPAPIVVCLSRWCLVVFVWFGSWAAGDAQLGCGLEDVAVLGDVVEVDFGGSAVFGAEVGEGADRSVFGVAEEVQGEGSDRDVRRGREGGAQVAVVDDRDSADEVKRDLSAQGDDEVGVSRVVF